MKIKHTMNKRTIFLLLAFATLIGIGTHLLFKPVKDIPCSGMEQKVKELQTGLQQLDTTHHLHLKDLAERNEHLLSQLQLNKVMIADARKQVTKLTTNVSRLSKRSIPEVDTGTYLLTCDSLQHQIGLYVLANANKDSIVNKQVEQYEYLLVNKDSTILCYASDYSLLRQTADTLVLVNHQLSE